MVSAPELCFFHVRRGTVIGIMKETRACLKKREEKPGSQAKGKFYMLKVKGHLELEVAGWLYGRCNDLYILSVLVVEEVLHV